MIDAHYLERITKAFEELASAMTKVAEQMTTYNETHKENTDG